MKLCILFFPLFLGAILAASPVTDSLFVQAQAALKAKDFKTAIARLDTLVKREPHPMPPELARAWAAVRTARAEADIRHARGTSMHAYDDASQALEWDPASGVAYAVRAILRSTEAGNRANEYYSLPAMSAQEATQKAAEADLDLALKYAPDALLTQIALGVIKWADGDRETGLTALETAYVSHDNGPWAADLLDRIARRSGGGQNLRMRIFNRRSAPARARVDAAPYDAAALRELASLCREIDAEQAKKYWTQLIAAHPDNVAVLYHGAHALFPDAGDRRQNRLDRARHLQAALEKYDGRGRESAAAAAMDLGGIMSELGRHEQAKKNYAMAAKIDPGLNENATKAIAQADAKIADENAKKAAEARARADEAERKRAASAAARTAGASKKAPIDVAYVRKKAEQGDATAQCNLGAMYDLGRGVAKNPVEAVSWYRKAAAQGHALAQYNLAVSYASGSGVAKNLAEAAAWHRKAGAQGHVAAQYNLGVIHANGRGVEKDPVEAVAWYRKAAAQGHAKAQSNLGIMYAAGRGVDQNPAEAVAWFRKAAAQGNALAQFNLGIMYEFGRGVEEDPAGAAAWYRKAAAQGHAGAQYNLGVLYYNGKGVAKDRIEALAWWHLAKAGTKEDGFAKSIAEKIGESEKNLGPDDQALVRKRTQELAKTITGASR